MNNKSKLINSKELQSEILKLRPFAKRYINGVFDGEYDLINPCGFDYVIQSNLFPLEGEYKQVIFKKDAILIIMNNGDIVELEKLNRDYFKKELIISIAKEAFLGKNLLLLIQYIRNNGDMESKESSITYDEAIQKMESSFKCGHLNTRLKEFCVNTEREDSISIEFMTIESNGLQYNNKIYVPNDSKKLNFQTKIIQSNKFRSHMQVHKKDFIIPYQNIIQYAVNEGYFNKFNKRFMEIIVEFPFDIGYSLLCETRPDDAIVYAKRKNRDIYSRFTLDGKKKLINKCVFILNRSYQKDNEYYLVTMFPGEYLIKEPEDRNIKDELERQKMLEFWRKHALVFNPKDIDLETAVYSCPYNLGA